MKLPAAIILALILFPFAAMEAQNAAANAVPLPGTNAGAPSSQPSPTPLSLIPETPVSVQKPAYHGGGGTGGPKPPLVNPVKKNETLENEEEIANRIKFREAKTRALEDAKIQDQLATARAARNDHAKREALRQYYKMLYAKILKIDGSIKKLVTDRQADSLKQLDQSKVRPEEADPTSATHSF